MNKHTKIAIIVAPLLAILSFAAADMYSEYKASQTRLFSMKVQNECDINAQQCVLKSGEFLLSFSDKQGETIINSTFPLDTASLFIVDINNKATEYPLGMSTSPYYWRAKTDLGKRLANKGAKQKLRIIAHIKGGSYLSEFESITR